MMRGRIVGRIIHRIPGRMIGRIVGRIPDTTRITVFFGVNGTGVDPRNVIGMRLVTGTVGTGPGTGCGVTNFTSGTAKSTSFGRALSRGHTRTICSTLITRNMGRDRLRGITVNKASGVFNGGCLGHMIVLRMGWSLLPSGALVGWEEKCHGGQYSLFFSSATFWSRGRRRRAGHVAEVCRS